MLKHYGITPLMVFDGGPLPAKRGTEVDRAKFVRPKRFRLTFANLSLVRRRREDNLSKANALAAQGRSKDARDLYTKCVDVIPEMALQLIKVRLMQGVHGRGGETTELNPVTS
jgi:exonuclease-1